MKHFLKFLIILLAALCGAEKGFIYAQKQGQAAIDSLLSELPKLKEDTNKVKLLKDLSFHYADINTDQGIKFGQQGLELATKLGWKKGIGGANCNIGSNYEAKSDYPKTLEYYFKALKMFEEIGNKKGIASVTGNIGIVYQNQSDYAKALEYYYKALKMNVELGTKSGMASVTGNIGVVYQYQSDYAKALDYYLKALKINEEIGDRYGIASVSCNVASVYQAQSDYPKALEYLLKALKINEEIGNKYGVALFNENIGVIYQYQNDFPKALEYDFSALKMFEEIGDKKGIAVAARTIGTVYTAQKQYMPAIQFGQQALKIAEEIGDKNEVATALASIGEAYLFLITDIAAKPATTGKLADSHIPGDKTERLQMAINFLTRGLAISKEINAPDVLQNCYEHLAMAYKLNGDYEKALESYRNYTAIKDTIFSKENDKKIMKIGMESDYQRKRFADSLKTDVDKKAAAHKLSQQRNYTFMGLGGIALLLCFSFFIVRERGKSEKLLLNILPAEVAAELKSKGDTKARHFDDVTVLFTDFVGFTKVSERLSAQELIDELHNCFKAFDNITSKYKIEKIKTIGDAYLAVAGLPTADPNHAENVVNAAKEITAFMAARYQQLGNKTFEIRVGIHSGSVVAGIVGVKKFAYDIWGDTVNTANRMESSGAPGKINISQTTYELVKDKFECEYRGEIEAKNKGAMKMFFVG